MKYIPLCVGGPAEAKNPDFQIELEPSGDNQEQRSALDDQNEPLDLQSIGYLGRILPGQPFNKWDVLCQKSRLVPAV